MRRSDGGGLQPYPLQVHPSPSLMQAHYHQPIPMYIQTLLSAALMFPPSSPSSYYEDIAQALH